MFSFAESETDRVDLRLAFLFLAAILVAYSSALQGGFIWDDDHYLTANPLLTLPDGLWKIWFTTESPQYYPLVFTSYWIERKIWGLNPFGYHLANVLLHIANAGILGLILRRLNFKSAWIVAGLFALHPVHVESVAWISERKNVLSGFFYLTALWAYLRYEDEAKRSLYFAALGAFILGLLSKTVICTLPAVILALRWMRSKPIGWKELRDLAPFFAAGIIMGLVTVIYERLHVGATGSEWHLSTAQHLILAGKIPWFYALKLVWPVNLMFIYPRWELDAAQILQWLPVTGIAALFGLLWWKKDSIGRGPVAALSIFLGTLFPALGFFNVYPMRYSFVADHFQYLASIAVLCLIAEPLARWVSRRSEGEGKGKWTGAKVAAGSVLMLLGFLTWKQGLIYASAKTVWEDTTRKNSGAIIAYNNLGAIYIEEGEFDEAAGLFKHILTVMPENAEAHHNLAKVYIEQGNLDGAAGHLRQAIAINPDLSKPHFTLGHVHALQKNYKEAESEFREAMRLEPGNVDAVYNLGLLFHQLKKSDLAALYYGKAIELDPNHVPARFNLGGLYYAGGNYQKALDQFLICRALAPEDPKIAAALAQTQKSLK